MKPAAASTSVKSPNADVWLGALLLLAAVGTVYWNSLNGPFIFDDYPAVVRNSTIRDLGHLGTVLRPPLDAAGATGRPLVNLSYAIDYALHRTEVRGYHIGSILLHALAALTLWGLLRRALRLPAVGRGLRTPPSAGERRDAVIPPYNAEAVAFGTALLWAVHPLLSESVVCIAQRNEVLVGLFYFLTFYAFVRSIGNPGEQSRAWQWVAIAACWLGMASKEVMATAPVLLLLFDRIFVADSWSTVWRERKYVHAGFFSSWLLLGWLMLQTQQRAGIVGFGLGMSSWDYLVTQCRAITIYLKLSVWPHPLIVDYGTVTYHLREVWLEGLVIVTLLMLTAWALCRRPKMGFLGAWFFVILAPSSSFVPLTTQTIAEHRMYLPLLAVVIAAMILTERLLQRRGLWLAAGLAVVLGVVTVRRNADYLDIKQLWSQTLAYQPGNARVQASFGFYYMQHRQWPEAIAAYEEAVRLNDTYADAHSDLGSLLLEVGRREEALMHSRRAVELKPNDPLLHFNLGQMLEKTGDQAGARREWETVLQLGPGENHQHRMEQAVQRKLGDAALQAGQAADASAHYARVVELDSSDLEAWAGWGQALAQENRLPEAVERFQTALRLGPAVPELHYNLGNIRLQMGQVPEAVAAFAEAVRLKPDFAMARHNLALALVRQGRAADAIPQYEQVVQTMPDVAVVRLNFALALAQAGRVNEAIAQDEAALRLDPSMTEARQHLASLRR